MDEKEKKFLDELLRHIELSRKALEALIISLDRLNEALVQRQKEIK